MRRAGCGASVRRCATGCASRWAPRACMLCCGSSILRARYFEAVVAVEEEGLVEKEAVCVSLLHSAVRVHALLRQLDFEGSSL
mmetsp:Transcript_73937/g.108482  ORF Transcript_73937/g.108482 Transcript_73937/m.108482 type:complete len:83 (+) Transcript_73937:157-405(+)